VVAFTVCVAVVVFLVVIAVLGYVLDRTG